MCRVRGALLLALSLLPGLAAAQSVNLGPTFHRLEERATRVITTFPDAVVDVRRGPDKALTAELRAGGRLRSRLEVRGDSRRVRWQGAVAGTRAREFDLPDQATVGLDWAAVQLYALHADEAEPDGTAEIEGDQGGWDGHVRRSRRALGRGRSAGALAGRAQRVETHFEGLTMRAELDQHPRRAAGGRKVDHSRFTATILDARTGARKGFVRWFDTAQVLTWKIDGGSEGVIMPDRLRGGWPFVPTMAWANVQAYQFITQAARTLEPTDPFAALWQHSPAPAPLARIALALSPLPAAALAWAPSVARVVPDVSPLDRLTRSWGLGGAAFRNEPGCDNLHWLDGSVFRACCDQHDKCYETNGCSASSWWWPFAGSWSCQRCNAAVVYCFCTLANPMQCGGGGTNGGDGGAGGGGCTSVAGGFCPVECQSCQAH